MPERNFPRHGYPVFYERRAERRGVQRHDESDARRFRSARRICPLAGTKEGTTFEVEIRGKRVPATVVKPPFYKDASHL